MLPLFDKVMRITLVQSSLHWENPEANRAMFAEKLSGLQGKTDLVVLPEMFTTGFSMQAATLAEPMDGPTMQWMQEQANALGAAITGSFMCEEDGYFFNRLVFMRPNGQYDSYDKKHLFSLAQEPQHFTAGRKRITFEWMGWKICPLICYDLRFPAWSRNTAGSFINGLVSYYDLLIYVANWPERRAHHWRSLLTARAIENQTFVVGVNIAGTDGNGLIYTGDSALIDFSGQTLLQISEGREDLQTFDITLEEMHAYRQQFPFLADRDVFEFKG